MALQDLLALEGKKKKIGLSEERVKAILPTARQYVSFWREYADLFVDFLLEAGNPQDFNFYYYQRVFLRTGCRHQYVYAVFPRASIGAKPAAAGQTSLIVEKSKSSFGRHDNPE